MLEHPLGFAREAVGQADGRRGPAQQAARGKAEEAFAAPVHQPEPGFAVEGEHRGVDLRHHRAEEGSRLHGPEPLGPQGLGQQVGFEIGQAKIVIGIGPAGAEGVVALPQGAQHVGERLQGPDEPVVEDREPEQQGARPATTVPVQRTRPGMVPGPEQHQRDDDRREGGRQGDEEDAARVGGHGVIG